MTIKEIVDKYLKDYPCISKDDFKKLFVDNPVSYFELAEFLESKCLVFIQYDTLRLTRSNDKLFGTEALCYAAPEGFSEYALISKSFENLNIDMLYAPKNSKVYVIDNDTADKIELCIISHAIKKGIG